MPKLCVVLLQLPKMESSLLARVILHFQSHIPLPMYHDDSIGRNSNLEKPYRTNSNDLNSRNQSGLVFQKKKVQFGLWGLSKFEFRPIE